MIVPTPRGTDRLSFDQMINKLQALPVRHLEKAAEECVDWREFVQLRMGSVSGVRDLRLGSGWSSRGFPFD